MTRPLLIGVSARIYYPSGPVLDLGERLRIEGAQAMEQQARAAWLMLTAWEKP